MKARETFAPMGPWLVTADESGIRRKLQLITVGQRRAQAEFQHQRHGDKIPSALHGSARSTPRAGDVIATGTNHRGLSSFQDGDGRARDAGLGRCTSRQDDLNAPGTRYALEHEQKKLEGATTPRSPEVAKK
jgi:2-keto-4-pentenoate hydratase/2-oxohepta-3-ene-1,7-dioic acid hydratase in catechol pathway